MSMVIRSLFTGFLVIVLESHVAGASEIECELPPLSEADVRVIANEFLSHHDINPEFRRTAETRVRSVGCNYEYEEAQKLDSFGVGVIVEVDRRRQVVDFRGSH
jgi:hypothetical protein